MKDIDNVLLDIWSDGRIDSDEKKLLKALLIANTSDRISYARNKSFAIADDKIQSGLDSSLVLASLNKIVRVLTSIEASDKSSKAYFSPGKECREALVNLLDASKKRIDICVFTISDNILSAAIVKAQQRGVKVRIITDDDKSHDKGSDIDTLKKNGVDLVMDSSPSHMHHKFALIDNVLVNGSFNWTRSATERNQENITVQKDATLISSFADKFNDLWMKFA